MSAKGVTVVLEKPKAAAAAARKTAGARKPKETKAVPSAYVVIDHPSNGETVSGLHYAMRIGASGDGFVEISFNGGEWLPCRHSAGFWWFDWGYFTPGAYTIVARLRTQEGRTVKKSAPVKCEVV